MESEVLTEDAVRSVACLDRTAFLEKWLDGNYGSAEMCVLTSLLQHFILIVTGPGIEI
jgi:hypothetical protein